MCPGTRGRRGSLRAEACVHESTKPADRDLVLVQVEVTDRRWVVRLLVQDAVVAAIEGSTGNRQALAAVVVPFRSARRPELFATWRRAYPASDHRQQSDQRAAEKIAGERNSAATPIISSQDRSPSAGWRRASRRRLAWP